MMAAFHQDKDIHSAVASAIYSVPIEKVSSEMRRNAKAVNFGIVYGLSEFGLSDTGLSLERHGSSLMPISFYTRGKRFRDKVIEEAKGLRLCKNVFHRKRFIPDLHSEDKNAEIFLSVLLLIP